MRGKLQFIYGFLLGAILFGILSSFASFAFTSSGATTTLTVPSGSTGRRVSLYNASGAEAYTVISGSTSAVIGTITTGTYFWRITDVDGSAFFDNSDWVTITNGDTWTWTNANLTCRSDVTAPVSPNCSSSWEFEERGSAGAYYRAIKKNATSDYAVQSYPLGSNLAAAKLVHASTEYEPGGVPNPSFESGTGVDATSWTESGQADRVSDKAFLGTYAMKFVTPTSAQATTTTMSVSPGTNYTLWVRIYNGLTGSGGKEAYVDLNDASGECNSVVYPQAYWQEISCNFNVSVTNVTMRLVVIAAGDNTGNVWFDGIRVVQGSGVNGEGMARNVTDTSLETRWLEAIGGTQGVTIDLGSQQSFNAVHVTQSAHEGYGYNAFQVSGSNDNSSFTEIKTGNRLQYDQSHWIYFTTQSYRYVRVNGTSNYGRVEFSNVAIYNIDPVNTYSDIAELYVERLQGYPIKYVYNNIVYTSKVTNGDGSVTYTKANSVSGGTLTIDTTYKKTSENSWRKTVKVSVPNTAESWRIAVRNGLMKNTSNVRHRVHSDGASAWATEDHTDYGDFGAGVADYRIFQYATLCDPQCFGIVADDGWNAKWVIYSPTEPSGSMETIELTGTLDPSISDWAEAYTMYGKQENGMRYILVAGNSSIELNFYYFFSDDPTYKGTAPFSYGALMDGKGHPSLSLIDKVFVGASYQSVRIRDTTQQTTQWVSAAAGYESQGQWNDSLSVALGIADQGVSERMLTQYRLAASYQPILYTDTFVSSAGYDWWMGLSFAAHCKLRFNTSISASEVRTSVDSWLSAINANGEAIGTDYADDSYVAALMTPDMYIRGQMMAIQELRSGKYLLPPCGSPPCWASSDETKLNNAITALRSLYDETNNYIHFSKYGHWYRESQGGASGGNHYISSDYVYAEGVTGETGAVMRFVVPSGHSGATLTVHYEKNSNNGKVIIKKNGTSVTQSPVDQYNASQTFTSTAVTETVSTGDVLTFIVSSSKNASSSGYTTSIDKLVIGASSYEEDDSNWVCAGSWVDCSNGRTGGWKTWKDQSWVWLFELGYRHTFNESMFTDSQLIAHFEHMTAPDISNGSFGGYNQMGNNDYVPAGYYLNDAGFNTRGQYHRGGDGAIFSLSAYELMNKYLNANLTGISYHFQEESSLLVYSGTWATSSHVYSSNNQDTLFPDGDQYKYSSTTGDYVKFSFKGTEIRWLATKGSGYGTADVYFCSGAACTPTLDTAGISLSNGTTLYKQVVYTKTGLSDGYHTIKIVAASGSNVNIDSLVVKTKPVWLSDLRKDLETAVRPVSHEYICTEHDLSCYGDSSTTYRRDSNSWNTYYRGGILSNFPSWRGLLNGIYYRRTN